MKIPIKYGLLTAVVAMAWILIAHNVVSNPASIVHQLGTPIFFNVLQFAMIYLGIKAIEREKGDRPAFKEALKTGVGISFVYGLTLSLFFVVVLRVIGTKWMAVEPGAHAGNVTASQIAKAFAGLFLLALVFGLIYSTVISFFLAKRRSEE
ncbi:MAG TPA: DUF4199 family protein [Pyrinomonadaceae bacterium]|jgi:hypothetical protein|nr:DUF4199 family protein [Pyrinomonadaceae bacterium]